MVATDASPAWPRTWLPYPPDPPDLTAPGLRLFCFPHSGGGASVFRDWLGRLDRVQVCPVQLPGRESRLREVGFEEMPALVAALVPVLRPLVWHPGQRYALYGHSLGADIAFALARALESEGLPPVRLFVAAHQAPHLPEREPLAHQLPDREFADRLRGYGGTPAEVLADQELRGVLLPALRRDFALFERFRPAAGDRVSCPISGFGGTDDAVVPPEAVRQWREATAAEGSVRLFPGGHFFVERHFPEVARAILADLDPVLRRAESCPR